MLRNRNTKIISTLGPASSTEEMIQRLFELGSDLFRLNFSHGTHETHERNIHMIRKLSNAVNKPIGIIADLQGPKLRVGQFANGKETIVASQKFKFDQMPEPGTTSRVHLPHPEIFESVKIGDELLVDDGKLAFRVDSATPHAIECTALVSGTISNNKGVNVPSTTLPINILTDKDQADLEFALKMGVDFIALSFVQTAEDIKTARTLIGNETKIIAKIEKPQAIKNLDAVLNETDAVMIARGDLGVELPAEKVPALQRKILSSCQQKHIPVIVATQMLESMITSPTPTRAEVSDVATAVYLETDAVMLSAESASGHYPQNAVSIMDRILFNTEKDQHTKTLRHTHYAQSLAQSAAMIANHLSAKCILAIGNSFNACAALSSARTSTPILAVTSNKKAYSQLQLIYGIVPLYTPELKQSYTHEDIKYIIESAGIGLKAQSIVISLNSNNNHENFTHLQTITI